MCIRWLDTVNGTTRVLLQWSSLCVVAFTHHCHFVLELVDDIITPTVKETQESSFSREELDVLSADMTSKDLTSEDLPLEDVTPEAVTSGFVPSEDYASVSQDLDEPDIISDKSHEDETSERGYSGTGDTDTLSEPASSGEPDMPGVLDVVHIADEFEAEEDGAEETYHGKFA